MKQPLPSLSGLYALEAAARHKSFAKAAAELNVTPAAISQRIRQMEESLGVRLFSRTTRAILLSERLQAALPFLQDGFGSLERAARELRRDSGHDMITVSVNPSFGSCWLLPRLERFRAAHPEITVHVDARIEHCDFERDGVDIAVRQGRGDYPGLESELLISDVAFAVCSPRLLKGRKALRSPQALAKETLLHIDWLAEADAGPAWSQWVERHGVAGLDVTGGLRFNMEEMAIRAALAGMGFALATHTFVADDLAAGRLVRALPERYDMPTVFQHYLVYPALDTRHRQSKTALFREWLRAEAVAMGELDGGPRGNRA